MKDVVYIYDENDKFINKFYDLSEKIEAERDWDKKLKYCERSLKMLDKFVKLSIESDGDLPPVIHCRDVATCLYMDLGKWKKAERVIKTCIKVNAYFPDSGEEELIYLENYKSMADKIVKFIKNNPGYLQKDIYKALKDEYFDQCMFKNFMRCTRLLDKVKFKNTNKLYLKGIADIT